MPLQRKVIVGFAGPLIVIIILLLSLSFSSPVTAEGSEVTVSIGDIEVSPNGFVKAPIMVRNVTALGGGAICISYDSTQVHVTAVTEGEGNALLIGASNSNNSANPGFARIASYTTRITGKTGDVIFADVTYKAVGAAGNTSALDISVESLFNIGYVDIPHDTENGSLSISETNITGFDTGVGAYPSISGNHNGCIIPNRDINVSKMYTYPSAGTGGHTEYVEIGNTTWNATAIWTGYSGDWHNITFNQTFSLQPGETYYYKIRTSSYPQIIHEQIHPTLDGSFINCTSFTDVNGNNYDDWIPAIKLFDEDGEG